MREGVLKIDEEPSIYIRSETYKINGEMKTRYGFIALLRIEEFGKGVHPHERTMSAPREDRLKLVKATRTNLSQIFSIFRDPSNKIQKLLLKAAESKPEESFTDEQGIIRKLWTVKDPNIISEIQSAMKEQDIIIADGHHRYETALEYKSYMESTRQNDEEPFDYVSMYFSSANDSGLTILPTHRKVSGLPWYDSDKFLKDLKQYFAIEFLGKVSLYDVLELITDNSVINNIFGIYTSENFWTARYLNSTNPKELDVDILHNIIIEKILGISREDIALGRYVHFCKSPEHAVEDVTHLKDQVSFLMNAMKPEELFSRVLNGFRMPQKSTYFYPKTLSGLVMYFIDKQSLE